MCPRVNPHTQTVCQPKNTLIYRHLQKSCAQILLEQTLDPAQILRTAQL